MHYMFKRLWLVCLLFILLPIGAQGALLEYGDTVEGTIARQGQQGNAIVDDLWTFMGNAGDRVNIRMDTISSGLDPLVYLYTVDYRQLAVNDNYIGRNAAIVNYRLPQSGAYYIRASYANNTTGRYALSLTQGPDPNLQPTARPSATPRPLPTATPRPLPTATPRFTNTGFLGYGRTVSQRLDSPTTAHNWYFTGALDDRIRVTVIGYGGFVPSVQLISPFGQLLNAFVPSAAGGNSFTSVLPVNGRYGLRVSAGGSFGTGQYSLSLQRLGIGLPITDPDDPPASGSVQPGWVLATGGTGLTNGAAMPPGEFQVEWYCNQRGYGVRSNTNNWYCVQGGQNMFRLEQIDFVNICRATYRDPSVTSVRTGRSATPAFNWRCYVTNTNVVGNIENVTTQPALTIATRPEWRLARGGVGLTDGRQMPPGEFQVEAYCRDRGYETSRDDNNWYCESDGEVSFRLEQADYNDICQATYKRDDVLAVRDGDNPVLVFNWRCYVTG